jgi:hypothetical protein
MGEGMKNLIRIEEAFFVILTIYLFTLLDYAWWWFALLFFAPDLAFIAYAAGPKVGGIVYDLLHHRGLLIGLYILGSLLAIQPLQLIALVFLAHSSLDRVFGYGLKYLDSPNHTHLGMVGKGAKSKGGATI